MLKTLLEDVKIINKVLLMVGLLTLFGLGTALFNAAAMRSIEGRHSKLTSHQFPATVQLDRIDRYATELMLSAYRGVNTRRFDDNERSLRFSREAGKKALEDAVGLDPTSADQASRIGTQIDRVAEAASLSLRAARIGDDAAAQRALTEGSETLEAMSTALAASNNRRVEVATSATEQLHADSRQSSLIALIVSLIGMGAGIAAAYGVVRRGITMPTVNLGKQMQQLVDGDTSILVPCVVRKDEYGVMAKALVVFRDSAKERVRLEAAKVQADEEQQKVVQTISDHLAAMAGGDLTAEIKSAFPPAYDGLRTNFNDAITALRALISTVAASADQIRTGSAEITQASEDLARRTEGSAANLEETSAAIIQMDGRLKATALAAGRTLERANQTISTVGGGRSIADDAVQAMGRVSDSAKGIDSVIEGLDKIAFQTRVLAMNAAVEAGRAGEAGRGFAVVADLVSALAMRAEEEAKRARDQLTVTQSDIVTAVDAVGNVDQALQAISGDVGAVHELLNSITNDNQAQAVAISEISAAVTTLDQATQQNAAMVEQTSAAARNLMTEVNALADQAEQFTVDRRGRQVGKSAGSAGHKPSAYNSPIKPLPRAAVAALTRPNVGASVNDWNEF